MGDCWEQTHFTLMTATVTYKKHQSENNIGER